MIKKKSKLLHPEGDPNMRVLKRSRKRLRVGDIFRLCPQDGRDLFGRVISTEAAWAPGIIPPTAILIYIYRAERSDDSVPGDDELSVDNLLIPPAMINRLPWSRGYFEAVAHRELQVHDRLRVHCFRDGRGRFFDEFGNSLTRAIGPVADWGLHSFWTIDDAVSDALGIPRAPE